MKVVIIGAGLAGITLAYLFKKEGVDVVVIEKDFVGSGETGYSTGVFPLEKDVLEFYREIEKYTRCYFQPVIYDHIRNGKRGKSVYIDGYNFSYYTSIVLEKEGVQFEVMNPFYRFRINGNRIKSAVTKRGEFRGDIFIVAAGASSPFIVNGMNMNFRWIRSLLLKPRKKFETVIYDEFVIKPEGERLIIREEKGEKVKVEVDVVNKVRGVDENFFNVVASYLEREYPDLMDASIERSWASLCSETGDPVKRFERPENLYVFAGFGCYGFGIIPGLAKKLVMEVLNG